MRHGLLVAAGAVSVVVLLPGAFGVPWGSIIAALTSVSLPVLAGLVALWLAGLLAHTTTLDAALPGLGRRRSLMLSLSGSAVSNVLPAGGAAGIALNYRTARAWGYDRSAFATYTVLTNVWDVLTKIALPAMVVLVVQVIGPPGILGTGSFGLVAGAASVAVTAAVVAALRRRGGLERIASLLNRGLGLVQRGLGRAASPLLHEERLAMWRDEALDLAARRWRPLTGGMLLYSALLMLLLASCLWSTGADVPLGAVLVAFSVERLATLLPLTPGGLGVVELGLVGVLSLTPGASTAGIASGVLLYRALTFGLEIPVGGLVLAWWELRRRAQGRAGR